MSKLTLLLNSTALQVFNYHNTAQTKIKIKKILKYYPHCIDITQVYNILKLISVKFYLLADAHVHVQFFLFLKKLINGVRYLINKSRDERESNP